MSTDNLAKGHRERVRLKYAKLRSFDSYEPYEILELLLFYAIPRRDTKPIAKNLISTFGSLKGVFDADIDTLKKVPGIGISTAVFLHSFSQTMFYLSHQTAESIRGSGDMGSFAVHLTNGKIVEEFYAVALNAKKEIMNHRKLASGRYSSVHVDMLDVVNFATDSNAASIVLIHNHTNGLVQPSKDDVDITLKIKNVLGSLGIALSDHLITCGDRYFSMADENFLGKQEK